LTNYAQNPPQTLIWIKQNHGLEISLGGLEMHLWLLIQKIKNGLHIYGSRVVFKIEALI
jgi:hypothetical protein